jgi:hypothetical protein
MGVIFETVFIFATENPHGMVAVRAFRLEGGGNENIF